MLKPINERTSREAMGLPESFRHSCIEDLAVDLKFYLHQDLDTLMSWVEEPSEKFSKRWGAATALGMIQDPRIQVLNPKLLNVPGTTNFAKGTSVDQISNIVASLADAEIREEWILKETPMHQVTVASFKIGKYPVTNVEYRQFLLETQFSEIPSSWEFGIYPIHKANHPVYTVSVNAAERYCTWLSQKTRRKFRLPTETEWEYVAAGPNSHEYPWGEEWILGLANTLESGLYQSTPVGIFPGGMSWCGAMDMAGNVEEYVADDYSPYPGSSEVNDDLLVKLGSYRIARGGSFTRYRDLARCKRRHGAYPKDIYVMGFRLAEDIEIE